MTLKEELEILRGEPIRVFTGDPMDIPCVETSDPERLCKHPVVSVHMITYNHEPYIRQAIEGVVMQKTVFEYELVIGEDCSTDRTREICFEYQRKYPDVIRVLWWHENVSKLGGNCGRTTARCRGEFIAFCEGDDYWTDPLKLQKQVDAMRQHSDVGLVFTNAKILDDVTQVLTPWQGDGFYADGAIPRLEFLQDYVFNRSKGERSVYFIMTASVMLRSSIYEKVVQDYDILRWNLRMGDKSLFIAMATLSDAYYLSDSTSVYRRTQTGAMAIYKNLIYVDSTLARLYFICSCDLFKDLCCPYSVIGAMVGYLHERFDSKLSAGDYRLIAQSIKRLLRRRHWFYEMSLFSRIRWHLFFVTGSIHVLSWEGDTKWSSFCHLICDIFDFKTRVQFYAHKSNV